MCFFGEGAANQGYFHEAANMAAVWKLPIVFFCENNLYSVTTAISETMSVPDVFVRAKAYGFPGVMVDGMDVLAVYKVVSEAVQRARKGGGPTLIESKTYRYSSHSVFHLDTSYRSKEEFEAWKQRDPIPGFEKKLIGAGIISEEEAAGIRNEAKRVIKEAAKFAEQSPYPGPETLMDNVYATLK
jgi:TPP-dependent pyruvate/acetoin dehydrogenase alpha subunit